MTSPRLTGIQACVFDAYGTLFDVHSAVARCRGELGAKAAPLSALWRAKQLEYTWLRSLMGRHIDFWQVTGDALDYAMAVHDVADEGLRGRLMESYLSLASYPEVTSVLERLTQAGMTTAILSNGAPEMLDAAVKSAKIGSLLDAVLSVEEVGVFKPHPSAYQLAVDSLGVKAERICFLSSNAFDVAGAAAFGFRVAWVNRFRQRPERLPGTPEVELTSLAGLLEALGL
ncbi:MAG: haloacid dehalogenase type II [Alphaproteobacteria bacterium]